MYIVNILFFSTSNEDNTGFINNKFVIFLKSTLTKMVATNTIGTDFLDLNFWQVWPKKIYTPKSFDNMKCHTDFEEKDPEAELGTKEQSETDTTYDTTPPENENDDLEASQSILACTVKYNAFLLIINYLFNLCIAKQKRY